MKLQTLDNLLVHKLRDLYSGKATHQGAAENGEGGLVGETKEAHRESSARD